MKLSNTTTATLKTLSKDHNATMPSVVEALLDYVLCLPNRDEVVASVSDTFVAQQKRGRRVDPAKLAVQIADLQAKLAGCGS